MILLYGVAAYAAVGTGFVIAVLLGMRPLSRWVERRGRWGNGGPVGYRLTVVCRSADHATVRAALARQLADIPGLTLTGIRTSKPKRRKRVLIRADVAAGPDDRVIQDAVARLLVEPGVRSASWERLPAPGE